MGVTRRSHENMGDYQKLNVWIRSKDLAVKIYRISDEGKLSKDFSLKDQMRRSATSIPSNIAEGDELLTDKQSIRHLYIAKGSLAELRTQLVIAQEINYLNDKIYNELESECIEIGKMLTALIKHRAKKLLN